MILSIDWHLIPWAKLNAHSKGHWRAKSAATKQLRELVGMMACTRKERFKTATISLQFYMPNAIRRDTFNMCSSMKPAIDAIVDQGIIPDDNWKVLTIGAIGVGIDRDNPRVEITLTEG
jgi:hypothetical protein